MRPPNGPLIDRSIASGQRHRQAQQYLGLLADELCLESVPPWVLANLLRGLALLWDERARRPATEVRQKIREELED